MAFDFSLGELESLAAKSLRGAGYPWGLATDGAHAVRTLAQHALPAADIVARLLVSVDRHGAEVQMVGDQINSAVPLCPIACGVAGADLGYFSDAEFAEIVGERPIFEPLLLAPFISANHMRWSAGHATIAPGGITISGQMPEGPTFITITEIESAHAHGHSDRATRAVVTPETLAVLEQFAGRTYAPATDASRRGAGEDPASP